MSSTTTLSLCLGALLTLLPSIGQGQGPDATTPFRIAFTSEMFTDVNENDGRAAVKAWATTIAREQGIEIEPDPQILSSLQALRMALRNEEIDAVGITTEQFIALESEVTWDFVFAAVAGGTRTSVYNILVHAESGIEQLDGLRGLHLVVHRSLKTSLVNPWFHVLLEKADLPPADEFLGKRSRTTKLSQAILPVFFGQADACIVSRRGFETLAELNPQVGKNLRVLAASPELTPGVFCFRANYDISTLEDLVAGVRKLHLSAAGRQVLTIFQSDRLEEIALGDLDGARKLLSTGHLSHPQSRTDESIDGATSTSSEIGGVQ